MGYHINQYIVLSLTNAGSVNYIYIIEGRQIINFSGCNSDHLEELLIDCIGIRDFHGIENLKWFDYNGDFSPTYVTPEPEISVDISPMASLNELEILTIRDFPYSIDVSCINNPKLKTISFTGCYTNEISASVFGFDHLLSESRTTWNNNRYISKYFNGSEKAVIQTNLDYLEIARACKWIE